MFNAKPITSCPKLSNNTPEMLVAATADVRLAAVSDFDVPQDGLSLAKPDQCHMS